MNSAIGQRWGNYRLIRLLGHGGFAEVYLGKHVRLGKHVAIKILSAPLFDEAVKSFQQEAQVIASLAHPHIVRLLDFDVKDGWPFLVLEYAPDGTLDHRHRHGTRLPLPETVTYVSQIANALQYAHEKKLIHRDVKPANMLIGQEGEILLTDFGLATVAHSTTSMHTQVPIGTLAYIAPEQIQGHPRPASDQYALGIVTYRWLTGYLPFQGSPTEMIAQHLAQTPPPLGEVAPQIPAGVEQVIKKALAKDPRERFGNVQDFANELRQAATLSIARSVPSLKAPLAPLQELASSNIASAPPQELDASSSSPVDEEAEATLRSADAQLEAPVDAAEHELHDLKPSPQLLPSLAFQTGQQATGAQRRRSESALAELAKDSHRERSSTSAGAASHAIKGRRIHLLLAVLGLLLLAGVALWSALLSSPPARSGAQASLFSHTGNTPALPGGIIPTRPSTHATPGQGAPTTRPTPPPPSGGPAGSTSAPRSTPAPAPTAAPASAPTTAPAPTAVPTPTTAPAPTQAPPVQFCLNGSPGTITITQVVGATLSLSGTAVTLTNCGSVAGHWVASSQLNNGSGWTSCNPASGDLPAHSSQTIHIAVGSPRVLLGTYTGQWIFTMGNASWTAHITLIVVA